MVNSFLLNDSRVFRAPANYLLAFWRDEEAVKERRNHFSTAKTTRRGRADIFVNYRLRIAPTKMNKRAPSGCSVRYHAERYCHLAARTPRRWPALLSAQRLVYVGLYFLGG